MSVRNNTLWAVPVYCIAAGILSYYLIILFLGHFTVTTLPDGSITSNTPNELIEHGIIFAAVVLVGGFFIFRKMTKQEIFISATIIVVFQIIISLIALCIGGSSVVAGSISNNISKISEWSSFISLLTFRITNNIWIGVFLERLAPYIFVLFGKK